MSGDNPNVSIDNPKVSGDNPYASPQNPNSNLILPYRRGLLWCNSRRCHVPVKSNMWQSRSSLNWRLRHCNNGPSTSGNSWKKNIVTHRCPQNMLGGILRYNTSPSNPLPDSPLSKIRATHSPIVHGWENASRCCKTQHLLDRFPRIHMSHEKANVIFKETYAS